QAFLAVAANAGAVGAEGGDVVARRMRALGGDDQRVAVAARPQPFAQHGLAAAALAGNPVRIDVRGVDVARAQLDIGVEHGEGALAAIEAELGGAENDAVGGHGLVPIRGRWARKASVLAAHENCSAWSRQRSREMSRAASAALPRSSSSTPTGAAPMTSMGPVTGKAATGVPLASASRSEEHTSE